MFPYVFVRRFNKESALEGEVKDLKQKLRTLTPDIWWKENIDGLPADQLAPLKSRPCEFTGTIARCRGTRSKEREPLRAAQFDVVRRIQEIVAKAYGPDTDRQRYCLKCLTLKRLSIRIKINAMMKIRKSGF